jgi:hypothetical protein
MWSCGRFGINERQLASLELPELIRLYKLVWGVGYPNSALVERALAIFKSRVPQGCKSPRGSEWEGTQ